MGHWEYKYDPTKLVYAERYTKVWMQSQRDIQHEAAVKRREERAQNPLKRTTIRMDPKLKQRLRKLAKENHCSMAEMCRRLIIKQMDLIDQVESEIVNLRKAS